VFNFFNYQAQKTEITLERKMTDSFQN